MKNRLYLSLAVVALLCLAGWTGYAQRSYPVRQAWEYKFILRDGGPGNWVAWREDGKELPKPVDMIVKSHELGSQGWELVTVTPRSSPVGPNNPSGGTVEELWVFKRSKS
jgi:hypothetical protein